MNSFLDSIRKVPDAFKKKSTSTNGKLILILTEQVDTLTETFQTIENWRDIDQAEGKALDLLGKTFGQYRGKSTDEMLRVLIKARIARNRSDGTFNSMLDALARALSTSPNTIKLKALYADGEPAAIRIEGIPLEALNKAGLSVAQFGYIAQQVVVAGISIAAINLSGTFSLSSQANVSETSTDFGLAPLDQSTGGTLGASFEPNANVTLPI